MGEKVREGIREGCRRDLLRVLGLDHAGAFHGVLEAAAGVATRRFAERAVEFDRRAAEQGLVAAARVFGDQTGARFHLPEARKIPADGPLLIVSNHPGLSDTLALFAAIGREDLRVIAEANPFLLALPHVRERLLFLPSGTGRRGLPLRPVLRHLKQGGAVLTFPAGRIEPDPALHPADASASLETWSSSVEFLAVAAPEVKLLPMLVSGVLSGKAQRHWLTRIRHSREGREQVGAFLQLLLPWLRRVEVRVAAGRVLERDTLDTWPRGLGSLVKRGMLSLLEKRSSGQAGEQVEVVDVQDQLTVTELLPAELQPPV